METANESAGIIQYFVVEKGTNKSKLVKVPASSLATAEKIVERLLIKKSDLLEYKDIQLTSMDGKNILKQYGVTEQKRTRAGTSAKMKVRNSRKGKQL